MKGPKITLAEGTKHLAKVLEHIEGDRWQLLGILHSLPEPIAEQSGTEDVGDTPDPVADLRATIECVLEDYIRPALEVLRAVLASPTGQEERGVPVGRDRQP